LQIAKIGLGKFGSKNAQIPGNKCDNSYQGQLGLARIISVAAFWLSSAACGTFCSKKAPFWTKMGVIMVKNLFFFVTL
jgi:hypothetical protein